MEENSIVPKQNARDLIIGLNEAIQLSKSNESVIINANCKNQYEFELQKAEERANILEGYGIALDHIDRVIKTICASRDPGEAEAALVAEIVLMKEKSMVAEQKRLDLVDKLDNAVRLSRTNGFAIIRSQCENQRDFDSLVRELNRMSRLEYVQIRPNSKVASGEFLYSEYGGDDSVSAYYIQEGNGVLRFVGESVAEEQISKGDVIVFDTSKRAIKDSSWSSILKTGDDSLVINGVVTSYTVQMGDQIDYSLHRMGARGRRSFFTSILGMGDSASARFEKYIQRK